MDASSYSSSLFWEWVEEHKNADVSKLRLAAKKDVGFNVMSAIIQVECRQRFGKKLSETLSEFPRFFFPGLLAGEQATSDRIASFHQELVGKDDIVVDLTAGLGIDAIHLAKVAKSVTAIEKQKALAEALRYNADGLNIRNIKVAEGDCTELISSLKATVAFIDPARRADDGSRVYSLADCQPNVLEMIDSFPSDIERLIVKASPMLDISQTIKDIPAISDIYILGTPTECKELVFVIEFHSTTHADAKIHAVTIFPDNSVNEFVFDRKEETEATVSAKVGQPQKGDLLYVPYPSTMKAAPVKLLSEKFGIEKFHANTHLYYGSADNVSEDFPGEILEIEDIIPWKSKNLKRFRNIYPHVATSVRNFGMTANALRDKLGVKESGNERLRLFGIGLGANHTDRLLIVARQNQPR